MMVVRRFHFLKIQLFKITKNLGIMVDDNNEIHMFFVPDRIDDPLYWRRWHWVGSKFSQMIVSNRHQQRPHSGTRFQTLHWMEGQLLEKGRLQTRKLKLPGSRGRLEAVPDLHHILVRALRDTFSLSQGWVVSGFKTVAASNKGDLRHSKIGSVPSLRSVPFLPWGPQKVRDLNHVYLPLRTAGRRNLIPGRNSLLSRHKVVKFLTQERMGGAIWGTSPASKPVSVESAGHLGATLTPYIRYPCVSYRHFGHFRKVTSPDVPHGRWTFKPPGDTLWQQEREVGSTFHFGLNSRNKKRKTKRRH